MGYRRCIFRGSDPNEKRRSLPWEGSGHRLRPSSGHYHRHTASQRGWVIVTLFHSIHAASGVAQPSTVLRSPGFPCPSAVVSIGRLRLSVVRSRALRASARDDDTASGGAGSSGRRAETRRESAPGAGGRELLMGALAAPAPPASDSDAGIGQ